MMDAFAGALALGGINTMGDVVAAQLKLGSQALYPVGRILLACYVVGGLIGLQSRQLMIGTLSGLMPERWIAGLYVELPPCLANRCALAGMGALLIACRGARLSCEEIGPGSAVVQVSALPCCRA